MWDACIVFLNFLSSNKIKWWPHYLDMPKQDSVLEYKHHHLVEVGRGCLFKHDCLLSFYIDFIQITMYDMGWLLQSMQCGNFNFYMPLKGKASAWNLCVHKKHMEIRSTHSLLGYNYHKVVISKKLKEICYLHRVDWSHL